MCSSESVQRIASSAIPELVCQVGWISAETCPAGASASKLYFLQILRHLLLEERPPASLENLMGNIVRVVERHIISSSNGEFDEVPNRSDSDPQYFRVNRRPQTSQGGDELVLFGQTCPGEMPRWSVRTSSWSCIIP